MTEPVVIDIFTPQDSLNRVVREIKEFLGLSTEDNERMAHQAVVVVYGLMSGHLRGLVPHPLPPDLKAVLRAAGTRYALMLLKVMRTGPQDPVEGYTLDLPSFTGWTFPEMVAMSRYRKRTA